MPANLSAQYLEAEQRYKSAITPEEKLSSLRLMLSLIPKHKGTEKLQADIKTRISRFTDLADKQSKKGGRRDLYTVPAEGAGQVALVGPTNSGKSELLAACTNAQPDIGDWTFTTKMPLPGMLQVWDIQIQLVDLPSIDEERTENWVMGVLRYADALLLVLDASNDDALDQLHMIEERLKSSRIELAGPGCKSTPEDLVAKKPAGVFMNKIDEPGAEKLAAQLTRELEKNFSIMSGSAFAGAGIDELGPFLFDLLQIIRIYSKQPGKDADMSQPFVLPRGATVKEVARQVHRDFYSKLRFARVWGSTKFPGQKVNRNAVVEDGDIVELNI